MQRAQAGEDFATRARFRALFTADALMLQIDGSDALRLPAFALAWDASTAHGRWRIAAESAGARLVDPLRAEARMTATLWRNARLATLAGPEPWGWVERGACWRRPDSCNGSATMPPCRPACRPMKRSTWVARW